MGTALDSLFGHMLTCGWESDGVTVPFLSIFTPHPTPPPGIGDLKLYGKWIYPVFP